jgi:hypothetical protein
VREGFEHVENVGLLGLNVWLGEAWASVANVESRMATMASMAAMGAG